MPLMSNVSRPVNPNDCHDSPFTKVNGNTPMPTRLERWMRSKVSQTTAFTPSRLTPLAAQSRELPVPYSLPAIRIWGVCSFR